MPIRGASVERETWRGSTRKDDRKGASCNRTFAGGVASMPLGSICGVEARAAHGQAAPNTDGGTLNLVAFINPTTVNASGRVAFNSQVDGSDRNQGVFVADGDGTISAVAIGCGGLGGSGDTTSS